MTAPAEKLRTLMPVLLIYVRHMDLGCDLEELRDAAAAAEDQRQVAFLDALIAACEAAHTMAADLQEAGT